MCHLYVTCLSVWTVQDNTIITLSIIWNLKKPKGSPDFSIFLTFYQWKLALLEFKLHICHFCKNLGYAQKKYLTGFPLNHRMAHNICWQRRISELYIYVLFSEQFRLVRGVGWRRLRLWLVGILRRRWRQWGRRVGVLLRGDRHRSENSYPNLIKKWVVSCRKV